MGWWSFGLLSVGLAGCQAGWLADFFCRLVGGRLVDCLTVCQAGRLFVSVFILTEKFMEKTKKDDFNQQQMFEAPVSLVVKIYNIVLLVKFT